MAENEKPKIVVKKKRTPSKRTARRRRRALSDEQRREANARYQREWRDRQRGGPPREPKPCGTYGAYRRHVRNGEPIDEACRDAYNTYTGLSIKIGTLRQQLSEDKDLSRSKRDSIHRDIGKLTAERNSYK